MSTQYRLTILIMAVVLGMNACTPTRVSEQVNLVTPPQDWGHVPGTRTVSTSTDLEAWWREFQDPLLDQLIAQALAENHDLRIAIARVREAQAMTSVAESMLYPSIDLYGSGGREKKIDRIIGVPSNQGFGLFVPVADIITGGLTARWEIDLFGSRQLGAESADAQAEGADEALHAAQVGLLAQVATNYMELRGVQQRTAILRENIKIQRQRLVTLKAFNRAGLSNQRDIALQATLLHSTESALPLLTATAANLMHRIGVLLGAPPETIENRLVHAEALAVNTPPIPPLLPASLLEQRPDLRLAQTEVKTMAANLGAARAELFPKLVLSVSGGAGALAVGGFPTLAESVYTLGSGLTAPIFNAGRIRAQIVAADARLDQAAANFEKTFLLALEDVENAFVAHNASLQQSHRLAQAETAAEQAYQAADALYQRGASDYLSLLDAQRNKLTIADERAKSETAVRVALISIYRAFGGGWTAAASN